MQLRRFLLIASLLSAFSPHLLAQVSGAITTASAGPGNCVTVSAASQSTVAIQITGTWSGTIQPEIVISGAGTPQNLQVTPSTSATAQSTITANGFYQARVAGGSTFLVCATAWSSGTANVFLNATQAVSLNGIGNSAASVPWSGVTAGSNTNALTMGTGGTFTPTGLGQIVSTLGYMQPGISAPSLSTSSTGGTIANSHTIHVVVSYNNALGETLPSVDVSIQTPAGAGTNSVTVTAPTLPTGYTSYTVYDYDNNLTANGPYLKQTASAACVAITGNCVIATIGAGSNPLTVPTAFPTPPNAQAFNGMYGEQPSIWFPKADGNYYPWLTVDWSTCGVNFNPCGTPTVTHRTFFTDFGNGFNTTPAYGAPITLQSYNNAFIAINHLYGVNTSTSNQDRGIGMLTANPLNYSGQMKGYEGLQIETDMNCNGCTVLAAVDTEVTPLSMQMQNNAVTSYGTGIGTNAARFEYFRGGPAMDTQRNAAVYAIVADQNSSAPVGGNTLNLFDGQCNNSNGYNHNVSCLGFHFESAGSNPYGGGQIALFSQGAFTPSESRGDFFIRNDIHGFTSQLNGQLGNIGLYNSDAGTPYNTASSETHTGSIAVAQIGTNSVAAIASCTGGASTYTFELIANDGNGGKSVMATQNTGATCTNPLTSGNPATVSIANVGSASWVTAVKAALAAGNSVDVYRCGGPMGLGKVGTLTLAQDTMSFGVTAFSDTGIVATGSCPTVNSTGSVAPQFVSNTNGGAVNKIAGTCTAGAATTCTVTFTNPFVSAPVCTATDGSNITTLKVTPSATSLVITTTGATSDVFDYICVGNPT